MPPARSPRARGLRLLAQLPILLELAADALAPETCGAACASCNAGLDTARSKDLREGASLLQQHRHVEIATEALNAGAASTAEEGMSVEATQVKGDLFLVGNGPVSEEDHQRLQNVPPWWLFRFNGMSNLRPKEPVGRVFMRSNRAGYWGLSCCEDKHRKRGSRKGGRTAGSAAREGKGCTIRYGGVNHVCDRVLEAREVILLGGGAAKQKEHIDRCNGTLPKGKVTRGVSDKTPGVMYDFVNMTPGRRFPNGWSSGFLALAHLRSRFPKAFIHVMGMNWNVGRAGPHPFQFEERLFRSDPRVTIHATPTGQYHRRQVCAHNGTALLQDGDSLR